MSIQRCPHCGTANRAGSNYCNNCGAHLGTETPPPPVESPPPPSPDPASQELVQEQPWLQSAAEEETEAPAEEAASVEPANRRLVTNIQGLLEPVRVFNLASDEEAPDPPPELSLTLGADQLRRLRTLMSEDPVLREPASTPLLPHFPNLRIPWIFALLGAFLLIAFGLRWTTADSLSARQWPGVAEAVALIDALPPGAPVLLVWGYDPATAGELELLALPVAAHLSARETQNLVVSLLPNGLASARRLFAQLAAPENLQPALRLAIGEQQFAQGEFLPSGAALPLLGQDLARGLNLSTDEVGASNLLTPEAAPVLTILLAAQAEDVQQWLEQVSPLDQVPLVAFTSAAADPVLRPYWTSGQLQGLVSGFDGAWSYLQMSEVSLPPAVQARFERQLMQQRWGLIAFLVVIGLGNLAALFGRGRDG